jgi:hypothetical protein
MCSVTVSAITILLTVILELYVSLLLLSCYCISQVAHPRALSEDVWNLIECHFAATAALLQA